ncbi:MAG: methyltransferase domain-containing protein [Cyanobacteria bacterium P01_H01_bin.58]
MLGIGNQTSSNQPSQKAILAQKIKRYLRYYPQDSCLIAYFLIRHYLSVIFGKADTHRTYIENLYKYFLGQDFSKEEVDFFLTCMEQDELTRTALLFSFLMIPANLEQKIFKTQGILSHHQARLELVQKSLPPAVRILDLGGGAGNNPAGSLLAMGYAHQPERIDIIDLPNEERFFKSSLTSIQHHSTPEGTQVHYHYTSMTNLAAFPDATFDLVWSGQSIEHITPAETNAVAQEVYRVLKPGASFCLDTPNRKLTRLQVKQDFVHPEHKIEYTPDGLRDVLVAAGFSMVEQKAVSPMPISYRIGRFNRLELIHSTSLNSHADEGYSFYLHCQKNGASLA